MGLFSSGKSKKQAAKEKADAKKAAKDKRDRKRMQKLAKSKTAMCTTCHKWYDPTNRRQFRKHSH